MFLNESPAPAPFREPHSRCFEQPNSSDAIWGDVSLPRTILRCAGTVYCSAVIFPNTSFDVIPTTNGVGNIKGIQCTFVNNSTGILNIFVDGGSAQALTLTGSHYPRDVDGETFTGWIPFNIRFTTSIRIQLQKGSGTGQIACSVSWALD